MGQKSPGDRAMPALAASPGDQLLVKLSEAAPDLATEKQGYCPQQHDGARLGRDCNLAGHGGEGKTIAQSITEACAGYRIGDERDRKCPVWRIGRHIEPDLAKSPGLVMAQGGPYTIHRKIPGEQGTATTGNRQVQTQVFHERIAGEEVSGQAR